MLLAGNCHHEDTAGGAVWGRTVEPHLTTTLSWHPCTTKPAMGRAVADAQCAAVRPIERRCDEPIGSRVDANRILVTEPKCTDAAVAALENLSRADASAMSDLAGAYYVRAQRKDNPADLLQAFDAAQRAVAMQPQPRGALFNRALILEALSLNAEAIQAWKLAADHEEGEWADDARRRRAELLRKTSLDGEQQWAQVRTALDAGTDDLPRLVAKFPASSERYFEEEVLRQWAMTPTPAQLARATKFANALSQFFKDRYFNDVAAALVHPSDALRQGHLRFAEARVSQNRKDAVRLYGEAAQLLQEAHSPQSLLARINYATYNAFLTTDYETALKQLDGIAADGRQYPSVRACVDLNRLFPANFADHYNELFTAYDALRRTYSAIGDWEDLADCDARAIAAMSVVGLKDPAWRKAFIAVRNAPLLVNERTRFLLVGATANAALDLNHPEAALLYQNVLADRTPPYAAGYLVSILDHRAAIELRLNRYDAAQRDLDAAGQIPTGDSVVARGLQARLEQVQGEAALRVDPARAVGALTKAIEAAPAEFATFRAMLFAQRAEAYRRIGQPAKEKDDVRKALHQLHGEEEQSLSEREPGKRDDLWISYFSRFSDTYDLLIRQLIAEGRGEEAFQVAERARAYETLDLVRKLPTAPAAFRKLAAHADAVDVAALQALLPTGTFLIEYRVFDDSAYAWILSRDAIVGKALKVRRSDVKRWTGALQDAAERKDAAAFDAVLEPAYDGLLRVPLDVVPAGANLVIVPDRELRGLPFAALRNPDTKRYVIEDHAVSMAGSALLYVFAVLRDGELPPHDDSALLIGDPAFDPRSTLGLGLNRFPSARFEVESIRPLYRARVLIGEEATAQQFLSLARDNAVIDIAAHAVVNGDAPSQSYLLFNRVLNAETLVDQLHTDKTRLIVLGACSSAGGLPVGDEGIAPLVRPLVGAGVPGVVGALWDIDDATAAGLLVSFHRHYRRDGKDAAAALRAAQLEMLPRFPAFIWAPFEVIGYASSPFASVGDITKEKPP